MHSLQQRKLEGLHDVEEGGELTGQAQGELSQGGLGMRGDRKKGAE